MTILKDTGRDGELAGGECHNGEKIHEGGGNRKREGNTG